MGINVLTENTHKILVICSVSIEDDHTKKLSSNMFLVTGTYRRVQIVQVNRSIEAHTSNDTSTNIHVTTTCVMHIPYKYSWVIILSYNLKLSPFTLAQFTRNDKSLSVVYINYLMCLWTFKLVTLPSTFLRQTHFTKLLTSSVAVLFHVCL